MVDERHHKKMLSFFKNTKIGVVPYLRQKIRRFDTVQTDWSLILVFAQARQKQLWIDSIEFGKSIKKGRDTALYVSSERNVSQAFRWHLHKYETNIKFSTSFFSCHISARQGSQPRHTQANIQSEWHIRINVYFLKITLMTIGETNMPIFSCTLFSVCFLITKRKNFSPWPYLWKWLYRSNTKDTCETHSVHAILGRMNKNIKQSSLYSQNLSF